MRVGVAAMRGTIREYTSGKQNLHLLWERVTGKTILRQAISSLAGFACGYILAGGSMFEGWLPFAFCLTAMLPMGFPFLASGVGAVLGYLQFWRIDIALAPICILLLIMTATAIFHNTSALEHPLFMPLLASGMCFLVGLIFFFDVPFSALGLSLLLARTVLCIPICLIYRRAAEERDASALRIALATLLLGLCNKTVAGILNPGLALATAVSLFGAHSDDALLLAALCGLAADLTGAAPFPVTAVLCFSSAAVRFAALRAPIFRPISAVICALIGLICFAVYPDAIVFSICLGAVIGLTLPAEQTKESSQEYAVQQLQQRLRRISGVFFGICASCGQNSEQIQIDPDQIYDRAAERICRNCVLFHSCWDNSAPETCKALHDISGLIVQRGGVEIADFPASFSGRCRHLEQFTSAVNEEVELLLSRRQYHSSLQQHRMLLREQMDCTARILRSTAQNISRSLPFPVRYRLETGFSGRAKDAERYSGDQCMCAALSRDITYIVLCDGMGTGQEAEQEGKRAAKMLMELLLSGCEPIDALRLLNTAYLVQGDGLFSAVDVLRLDLNNAQAELYKWGSSTTYLKKFQTVRAFGTASPPPGIGVGEAYRPERLQFSLQHGEILVLTTDGAAGEVTQERLRTYVGANLPQLAGFLVRGTVPGSDDASVVAVRLYPRHS